jgi:pimeloyl-ACP methyl ester carboxylesterase
LGFENNKLALQADNQTTIFKKMKRFRFTLAIGVMVLLSNTLLAQDQPCGTNDKAGRYAQVGDARIYYEVYGQGQPILLLHGGLYGYIDEFKEYISVLSKHFKVIAVATRGHGKSEIGTKPFSYKLFADDAISVLEHETRDSAIVVGFSDGGITAYVLASEYRGKVKSVVAIGGGLSLSGYNAGGMGWLTSFTPESFEKYNTDFIRERKKLMPQPDRWNEFLGKLKLTWTEPVWVSPEKAKDISCPVLTIGGDRDDFLTTEQFVQTYKMIPRSQLAIIPNSGHVESMATPYVLEHIIMPFVLK